MASPLARLVDSFATNPVVSGKAMRHLLERDSQRFVRDSLPLLQTAPDTPGFCHLLTLLQSHDLILRNICDPALFTTHQSIALAKQLARIEPHFEIKLAKALLAPNAGATQKDIEQRAQSAAGRRLLEIISAISEGTQSLLVAQLLKHPDAHVRSKAALLIGKSNKNAGWAQQRLLEKDGRVRANALEALWGVQTDECRSLFWSSLTDPDNRVAGNAVLGLHRLGEPATIGLTLEMAVHSSPNFRKTAVWVMGETGDLRFLPWLERVHADPSHPLKTHAFHAFMKLRQKRSRLSALPPLAVQVLPQLDCLDGWKEAHVSVRCGSGSALTALKATQFVLSENGEPTTEFQVQEFVLSQPLFVGFAPPHLVGPVQRQALYRKAFASCVRHKRAEDKWMMLKYTWSDNESSITPKDADLLVDSESIEEAAGSPKVRATPAGNLWQAGAALVRATAAAKGARHVILIDDGSSRVPDRMDIAKLASKGDVTIHAIGSRAEILHDLCRSTGGRYVPCSDEGDLPELLEGLYGHLIASYQVRYRSRTAIPSAQPVELKIQVWAEEGLGEAASVLP